MAYVTFTSPECIAAIILNDPPDNFISRAVMAEINRIIDEELRPKIKLCSDNLRISIIRIQNPGYRGKIELHKQSGQLELS